MAGSKSDIFTSAFQQYQRFPQKVAKNKTALQTTF